MLSIEGTLRRMNALQLSCAERVRAARYFPELSTYRRGALWGGSPEPRRSVPSMGRILLDERSQSEPMTATVAEPQGVAAR